MRQAWIARSLALLIAFGTVAPAAAFWEAHPENYLPSERCGPDATWLQATSDRIDQGIAVLGSAQSDLARHRVPYDQNDALSALAAAQASSPYPPAAGSFNQAVVDLLGTLVFQVHIGLIDLLAAYHGAEYSSFDAPARRVGSWMAMMLPIALSNVAASAQDFLGECGPNYWVWVEPDAGASGWPVPRRPYGRM